MIRKVTTIVLFLLALVAGLILVVSYQKVIVCWDDSVDLPDGSSVLAARRSLLLRKGEICYQWHSSMMIPPVGNVQQAFAEKARNVGLCRWYSSPSYILVHGPGYLEVNLVNGVAVPLWVPFVLFFMYPSIAFIRGPYRRHRREEEALCLKCGYDLRGLPEFRCPECGEGYEGSSSE